LLLKYENTCTLLYDSMLRATSARLVATAIANRASSSSPRVRWTKLRRGAHAAANRKPDFNVTVEKLAPYCELITTTTTTTTTTQREEQRRPLTLVIGWFGAELRYVRKLCNFWLDSGCDAVAIAPPSAATLLPPVADAYGEVVLKALRRTLERKGEGREVVIHVASNGGFIFGGTLLLKERLEAESSTDDGSDDRIFSRVKGCVFDCAPGDLRPDIVARAFAAVLGGRSATKDPAPVFETLAKSLLSSSFISRRLNAIDQAWGKVPAVGIEDVRWLDCPSMFIYSEADVLISPREIEAYAKIREKYGEVTMHRFLNASHCEIGRDHAADYAKHVKDFVDATFRRR
jgi:pimeloyl-ACP methyl ester carboxylesterase